MFASKLAVSNEIHFSLILFLRKSANYKVTIIFRESESSRSPLLGTGDPNGSVRVSIHDCGIDGGAVHIRGRSFFPHSTQLEILDFHWASGCFRRHLQVFSVPE